MSRPIHELQRVLQYRFTQPGYLIEALTHPSYAGDHQVASNQRLEFLGDAVLELCVSRRLYENSRTSDEGVLTKWRARLVCEESLSACARKLGLGEYLLLGGSGITDRMAEKPSVLCDTMESVIAAVYLDGGLQPAAELVDRILGDAMRTPPSEQDDFKSRLQILLQAKGEPAPTYEDAGSSGPDHMRVFTCRCIHGELVTEGSGTSKKRAQQNAAEKMIAACKAAGSNSAKR